MTESHDIPVDQAMTPPPTGATTDQTPAATQAVDFGSLLRELQQLTPEQRDQLVQTLAPAVAPAVAQQVGTTPPDVTSANTPQAGAQSFSGGSFNPPQPPANTQLEQYLSAEQSNQQPAPGAISVRYDVVSNSPIKMG